MNKSKIIYLIPTAFFFTLILLVMSVSATTDTTFPVDDAGLSAYIQVEPTCINEAKLIDAYDTTIIRNLTYSIGTVKINNGVEDVNIYVYVGMDGWIIGYVNKTKDSTGIVMQWTGYKTGSLTTTTLKDAVKKITKDIGCNYSDKNMSYYDFRHPNATNVTIVAEYTTTTNTFSIVLPFSPTAETYEAAYSHYGYNTYKYTYNTYLRMDGKNINTIYVPHESKSISYGIYDLNTELTAGESHDISVSSQYSGVYSYAANIIIYHI